MTLGIALPVSLWDSQIYALNCLLDISTQMSGKYLKYNMDKLELFILPTKLLLCFFSIIVNRSSNHFLSSKTKSYIFS